LTRCDYGGSPWHSPPCRSPRCGSRGRITTD
jgi:hypothetical protein